MQQIMDINLVETNFFCCIKIFKKIKENALNCKIKKGRASFSSSFFIIIYHSQFMFERNVQQIQIMLACVINFKKMF